jgi:hypothetical protein
MPKRSLEEADLEEKDSLQIDSYKALITGINTNNEPVLQTLDRNHTMKWMVSIYISKDFELNNIISSLNDILKFVSSDSFYEINKCQWRNILFVDFNKIYFKTRIYYYKHGDITGHAVELYLKYGDKNIFRDLSCDVHNLLLEKGMVVRFKGNSNVSTHYHGPYFLSSRTYYQTKEEVIKNVIPYLENIKFQDSRFNAIKELAKSTNQYMCCDVIIESPNLKNILLSLNYDNEIIMCTINIIKNLCYNKENTKYILSFNIERKIIRTCQFIMNTPLYINDNEDYTFFLFTTKLEILRQSAQFFEVIKTKREYVIPVIERIKTYLNNSNELWNNFIN